MKLSLVLQQAREAVRPGVIWGALCDATGTPYVNEGDAPGAEYLAAILYDDDALDLGYGLCGGIEGAQRCYDLFISAAMSDEAVDDAP